MSGEEYTLPVELGKLEIESGRGNNLTVPNDENPFQRRSNGRFTTNSALFGGKCNHCNITTTKKFTKNKVAFKRTNCKLLKDSVLKYLNNDCQNGTDANILANSLTSVSLSPANPSNNSCKPREPVSALVSGCNQLSISIESSKFDNDSCPSVDIERVNQASNSSNNNNSGLVACSQQALNPPCDVTMDELACYFETLVHIPKKMSSMAEMMYI